jgi:hypothetical protein
MTNRTNPNERRRHPRYAIKGRAIAVVRPAMLPAGTITQLSRSGLVFNYRDAGHQHVPGRELDIIWSDYTIPYYLKKLPVRTVSDIPLETNLPKNDARIRRHVVAFEHLSSSQQSRLDQLIVRYGSRIADDRLNWASKTQSQSR